jgi:hypothetical protein
MKLFLYLGLVATTGQASEKRPTRLENMRTWWSGGFEDNTERGVGPCEPLDLPENAESLIYHEPKPDQKKFAKIAEALCAPGYFPDLSNGQKLKTVCKIVKDKKTGEKKYKWIRQLPKCVSCSLQPGQGLEEKVISGINDPVGSDVFCSINDRNEHHCKLACLDDRKKVNHDVFSRSQKRANIDCRCKKGNCTWTTHGNTDINLKGFKCQGKGKLDPIPVPTGCKKSPEDTCTPVTPKVQLMNSWTCRNCFRIRAFYKFKPFQLMAFNNQDYLDITFSEEVFWIKQSHPATEATNMGNNTWRVKFSQYAMFSNKEVDFSAELRSTNGKIPKVVDARSCPCSQYNVKQ